MTSKITGFYSKFKVLIKDNWGAPFIVGFIILLVLAPVFYLTSNPSLADSVSVFAYCVLFVGIVIQIAFFLKSDKKGENNDSN